MPIYEYRCENGHTFEAFQSMSDESLTECVECGAPVRRMLHAPAIHFKGSGFHNTDYGVRGAGPTSRSGSENGSGSSEGGSSEKSSSSEDSSTKDSKSDSKKTESTSAGQK